MAVKTNHREDKDEEIVGIEENINAIEETRYTYIHDNVKNPRGYSKTHAHLQDLRTHIINKGTTSTADVTKTNVPIGHSETSSQ